MNRKTLQFWLAVIITLAGIALLFMGFWVVPVGIIDSSILIAFGEVATFAGALIGIDYKYRLNNKDNG